MDQNKLNLNVLCELVVLISLLYLPALSVQADTIVHSTNITDFEHVPIKATDSPVKPVVNPITDQQEIVSGTAEIGNSIIVYLGEKDLGSCIVDSFGKFSVKIGKQKAGTVLSVVSMDGTLNKSEITVVKVLDKTPPQPPVITFIKPNCTEIKGKTESNATIKVMVNGKEIASVKANQNGAFSVKISKSKVGKVIYIFAVDSSRNKGKSRVIKLYN